MKATDLMIGDWVHTSLTDECQKIWGIRETGVILCNDDFCPYFYLEPIPLTPKILGKNGFLKSDDFFCMAEDFYDIDIIEISDGIWRVRYDNLECSAITYTFHICFVHELQHALKLCGIDKEIVI